MIKKIVFLVSLMVGLNLSVSAATIIPGTTLATLGNTASANYTMTINGVSYSAFCQDANLSYGTGTYKVKEELGARTTTGTPGSVAFYDQAVIEIFAYFEENGANYDAQSLALRSIIALFNFDNDGGDGIDDDSIIAFRNLAVSWITADEYVLNQVKTINAKLATVTSNQLATTAGSTSSTISSKYSDSEKVAAKAAFTAAIQAIIDYIDNGYNTPDTATLTSKSYTESQLYATDYFYTNVVGDSDEVDYAVNKIVLTPENFATDGNGKFSLKVDEASGLNEVCYVVYGGTSYAEFDCDNGAEYALKDGDYVVVYIYAEKLEEEFCDNLGYDITYSYTEDSINSKVYIIYNTNHTTTASFQRFIISVPADQVSQEVSGVLNVCEGDCTTEVIVPTDCIDVDLGEQDYYTGSITPSANLEYCLINTTDDAGNSYVVGSCEYDIDGEDVDNGMSGVANQTSKTYGDYTYNLVYGTVSCYETYSKIEFPGIQTTDSGRYIKIGASIEATKMCITSDIDYDAFIEDITLAQEAMVDAYNEYMSYKEASLTSEDKTYSGCETCDYTNYYMGEDDTYEHENISFNSNGEGDLGSTTTTDTWSSSSKGGGSNHKVSYSCGTDEEPKTCYKCGTSSCSNGSSSTLNSQRSSGMDAASADLTSAQNAFKQAITNLISLIGGTDYNYSVIGSLSGWDMLFPINPTIEYTYEENYTSLLSTENKYLTITSDDTTDPSYVYSSSTDVSDELDDDDAFESRVFVYCTTSSCNEYRFKNFPTEEINYVIGEIEKYLEYETPEVFYNSYPTGTVIYSEEELYSEEDQATLINGLPISLNTSIGLYSFTFTITNLGEYYYDCTGGRLNDVIEFTEENEYDFSNDYVCYYKVNCPECDITTDLELDIPETPCTTCILNGTFQMYFRTISTNTSSSSGLTSTFNPNDRDLGYNWSSNTEYSIIAGKAETTLTEIYAVDYDAYSEEPLLSVTLTSSAASYISDKYNSGSSYADDTLTCYDWGDYENVFCYSDVLSELSSGTYSSNFDFASVRSGNVNNDVDYTGNNYWTAWKITETTEYYFGGPAWK